MYFNVVQPVIGMPKGDEASPSIILAGQALLVKMFITLEPHGIFGSNFVHLCISTFSTTGLNKGDEVSPSIILARWSISIGVPLYLHTDGDRSHRHMCRNLN